MANPYSIIHNYDQPIYTPPFEFQQMGLAFKQGKYDQNKLKLQSALDNYAMLDIYRDVDKEYAEKRLEAVNQISNRYVTGDLSSDGFTNSILKNMGQIIDPTVKSSILSTKRFQKEQLEWQQLKEKEPDAYNDKNYAYSLQASKEWRDGTDPGQLYRGGGGVRKYVDYNKAIRENIPKIQDMLKAEWIEDAGIGVGGYFREISTKRAVDRGKMENALSTFLGEKEMGQIRIDAWAKYSQMGDDQLRDQFDDYFSPQLEAAQSNLDKYTKMLETEKDPNKKAEIQKLMDVEQKNFSSLSANSFDNVVEKVGKEAAYTTLFARQFKDNYLNAYSYAPLEIKREVNQLDVENRNLEVKLREYDLSKTNADRNYTLSVRKQELDEMKAAGNGVIGNSNLPLLGPNTEIDQEEGYGEGRLTHVKAQQKLEEDAISDMKKVLSPAFGSLNTSQLQQLSGQLTDIAGKDKITVKIDGKTTTINIRDPNNFQAVKNFQNHILNDSPTKKFEQDGIVKIIDRVKNNLTKVAQGDNPDINLSAMLRFNYRLVEGDKDENGKVVNFKVAPTNYKGQSYYGYLLKKENRTEAENLTLDWYVSMHVLGDGVLSQEQQKSVFGTIQNKIYSKIDSDDLKKLPQNYFSARRIVYNNKETDNNDLIPKVSSGTQARLVKYGIIDDKETGKQGLFNIINMTIYGGGYSTEINKLISLTEKADKGDKEALGEVRRISENIRKEYKVLERVTTGYANFLGDDYFLSQMTAGDLEWNGGGIGKGFDKYLKESFSTLSQGLEQRLAPQNLEMSLREMIYNPGQGKVYQDLAYSIGLPKDSKMPIVLTRKLDSEGRPTGEVDWRYQGGTTAKPVVVTSAETGKPLTREQTASIGIDYVSSGRPQYRAEYGENAPKIELGSSKVDKEVETRVRKLYPNSELPLDNIDRYLGEAEKYGVQGLVAGAIKKFDSGAYKFKMVPENNSWHRVITLNDKEIYSEDMMEGDYTDDEVKKMYETSYYDNQALFNNYIIDLIQDAQRDAKINAAAQRQTTLQ